MAILEHFSACILIDGEPCPEYEVEEDQEQSEKTSEDYPKVTKYVEVVAGAQFVVRVEPIKTFDFGKGNSIQLEYYLDGKRIIGKVTAKAAVMVKKVVDVKGKTVGNGQAVRPFKFGNIKFSKLFMSDSTEANC